jgi:hypothetical protein
LNNAICCEIRHPQLEARYPDVRHHRVEDALRAKIFLYAAAGLWNEEISQRTLRRLPAIAARARGDHPPRFGLKHARAQCCPSRFAMD